MRPGDHHVLDQVVWRFVKISVRMRWIRRGILVFNQVMPCSQVRSGVWRAE